MDFSRCFAVLAASFAFASTAGAKEIAELGDSEKSPQRPQAIDFENVRVTPGTAKGTYLLQVSGTKPYRAMQVKLSPRVYAKRPVYWGIEVYGLLPDRPVPAVIGPYTVSMVLRGPMGHKGVEVIGRSTSRKIKIPPAAQSAEQGNRLPEKAAAVLRAAGQLELFSLDPSAGSK